MNELNLFLSAEDALFHLANIIGKRVVIGSKNQETKNPRNLIAAATPKLAKDIVKGMLNRHRQALFTLEVGEKLLEQVLGGAVTKDLAEMIFAAFIEWKLLEDYQNGTGYQFVGEDIMEDIEMEASESEINLEALDAALRIKIAESGLDLQAVQKKLMGLKNKISQPFLNKTLRQIDLSEKDINSMKIYQLINHLVNFVGSEEEPEEERSEESPSEEEVTTSSEIESIMAADTKELGDDLLAIFKKRNSVKMDKKAKIVLKITPLGDMTMAELIDLMRDSIAKPDDDSPAEEAPSKS